MARLHTGLALLRYEQSEGAERRPGGGRRQVGRPAKGCGIGPGHKHGTCNPAATSGQLSGEVGWNEGGLERTEVLEGEDIVTFICEIVLLCKTVGGTPTARARLLFC